MKDHNSVCTVYFGLLHIDLRAQLFGARYQLKGYLFEDIDRCYLAIALNAIVAERHLSPQSFD